MKIHPLLALTASLCVETATLSAASGEASIAFSDPNKPGRLTVRIAHGEIEIQGGGETSMSSPSSLTPIKAIPVKSAPMACSSSAATRPSA
ncbi:MAG: hypothetical protein J6386_16400 [Candidatus Synoicihabitans palmerolidicus]|nr:hypothetical protein [Candidatus Synoicihabitans palmerolidicus]